MCAMAASEYDAVPYPSAVYPQTHPDRLATLAQLFGMPPAPVERSRVLELGCGDGTNLIAMACTLPGSRFHGVDLASSPIAKGNRTIEALGLCNVCLRQMNLLEVPGDLGQFDDILAHGLYSWVPAEVREKILALCRDHLDQNGVAYISYNAYPGNHLRDLARHMMRFHVPQLSDTGEQVRQARTLMKFLAEAKSKRGHWQDVLQHQFDRIQKYIDAGFYHDDLSAINQPFYFHEFNDAANRHGLQFLAEADFTDMHIAGLTEEAEAVIRKMDQCNLVAREQYQDFIEGRSFRQTLLCRQERQLDRELKPERVFGLLAAADASPARMDADLTGRTMEDFQRGKAVIATSHPVLKSALAFLGKVWPRRVPFGELLETARTRAGSPAAALDADRRDLGEFLIRCYGVGFVDLHSHASAFVTEISERPVASPLARWQIQQGPSISSLRHLSLKIEDALGRDLLRLLDGTRDRAALLEELGKRVTSGGPLVYRDGKPVTEPKEALEVLAAELEPSLLNLARLGVLVG